MYHYEINQCYLQVYKEPHSANSITKHTGDRQAPYKQMIFGWDTLDSCRNSVMKDIFSDSDSIIFTAT